MQSGTCSPVLHLGRFHIHVLQMIFLARMKLLRLMGCENKCLPSKFYLVNIYFHIEWHALCGSWSKQRPHVDCCAMQHVSISCLHPTKLPPPQWAPWSCQCPAVAFWCKLCKFIFTVWQTEHWSTEKTSERRKIVREKEKQWTADQHILFQLLQARFSLLCLSRPQNAGCQGDPSTKTIHIE